MGNLTEERDLLHVRPVKLPAVGAVVGDSTADLKATQLDSARQRELELVLAARGRRAQRGLQLPGLRRLLTRSAIFFHGSVFLLRQVLRLKPSTITLKRSTFL